MQAMYKVLLLLAEVAKYFLQKCCGYNQTKSVNGINVKIPVLCSDKKYDEKLKTIARVMKLPTKNQA